MKFKRPVAWSFYINFFLFFLDSKNYYETCEFINSFASRMINSKVFPVEQSIPDNMKNELDIYLGRKERN